MRAALAGLALVVVVLELVPLLAGHALAQSRRAAANGRPSAARDAALRARALEPWAIAPLEQLALLAESRGDLAEAQRWVDAARRADADDWQVRLLAARIETRRGAGVAARADLRAARRLNPRSPALRRRLTSGFTGVAAFVCSATTLGQDLAEGGGVNGSNSRRRRDSGAARREGADSTGRRRFWRDSLRRRVLALADAIAVVVAAVALWASGAPAEDAAAVVLFIPGWLLVAKVCGLYDRDHRSIRCLTIDELGRIVGLALAGTAALATVLLVFRVNELTASAELRLWILVAASLFAFRVAARAFWRRVTPPERALILGEGPLADATRRKLELFPDIHIEVVAARESCSPEELRVDNDFLDGVDRMILVSPTLDERLLAEVIAVTRARQIKLSVVPPVRGMLGTAVQLSHVADLPFIEYHTWDTSRTTLFGKRILDLTGSICRARPPLASAACDRGRNPPFRPWPGALRAAAGGHRW